MAEREQGETPREKNARQPARYEPPQLRKYGSLAELTRTGSGTRMEATGPTNRFA